MSVDARVSKDLVETLRDGQEGFAKAAEKLADSDAPEIGATFRGYSEQRRQFADELEKLAQSYGDDVDSLDWGPVCWQLGRAGVDRRALDAIHAGRKIRNDLAHGRPVDWSAIQSFETGMNEVRLSR